MLKKLILPGSEPCSPIASEQRATKPVLRRFGRVACQVLGRSSETRPFQIAVLAHHQLHPCIDGTASVQAADNAESDTFSIKVTSEIN
jgi:hypothetical protein